MTFTSDIKVEKVQSMGGDYMVAAAAKVSTSGEDALQWADPSKSDEVGGLISYLMQHRHGTPFEHSALSFFVHAPIFVWREWHRHRIGFSYNEESARYKTLEPVFYIPLKDRPMKKVEGWKPGRPKFEKLDGSKHDDEIYAELCYGLTESYSLAYKTYLRNLELGIDPGLARDCLPVGIYSSCWVTCNPRSLMAFLALRTNAAGKSYPLHEIELAAVQAEVILEQGWPLTHAAFEKHGRVAP